MRKWLHYIWAFAVALVGVLAWGVRGRWEAKQRRKNETALRDSAAVIALDDRRKKQEERNANENERLADPPADVDDFLRESIEATSAPPEGDG